MALYHVITEHKQKRFNNVRDIGYHENSFSNNFFSEIFLKIKNIAFKSFNYGFHLSMVLFVDKLNGLLFERFRISDTFCFSILFWS